MKQFIKNLLVVLVGVAILYGLYFYYQNLRGIGPAINNPPEDITTIPSENATDFPLKLPDNFKIEIFAKGLPGARVMAFDGFGNMWVSQTSLGKISYIEIKDQIVPIVRDGILRNLDNPHGLVFDYKEPFILYYAEGGKISKIPVYSDADPQKIADLPTQGGGHFTRTLKFGPDDRLYVSIGSSCNVCVEKDERRAAIYTLNRDGSDFKKFASGLRNTVFFDWSYVDGRMWGTDMGRDLLGDDIPPDEINILEEGKNYGWPNCFGKKIHDTNFDKNVYIQDPCLDKTPPVVEMQAHSAPLGLAFVPEEGWPEDFWYDLIVAFHGSWNRSVPTGYKLVRIKLDAQGNYEGTEDFVTGWLQGNSALGRPVDILIQSGGTMFVSDDKAGVIYKISYTGDSN